MKFFVCLLAALIAAAPAWVGAQTSAALPARDPAAPTDTPVTADSPAPTAKAECGCVPAGTLVELEIAEPLSSALQKRGDKFAIRLHAPITRDGVVVVPAGTSGLGEIVHADRSHGGGKPGELLIAARHLDFEGTQVPLRGLKFGGQGKDNSGVALGTAMAIGVFAQFIHGRELEIPAGTIVSAKLAQDLGTPAGVVSAQAASDASPAPSASTAPPASNKE